ncbi:hypothetical protein PoB_006668700 [Plakobranchus ocellatus]|uniref:Uncharacterized protein n=1 Tax=Plakobranchus ocellatus TaxID=259542 RepID=A0AAV4D7Q5_9GAST|nr:hypothetical protein PoB_006668700 [Plakobranchus ocellatus]
MIGALIGLYRSETPGHVGSRELSFRSYIHNCLEKHVEKLESYRGISKPVLFHAALLTAPPRHNLSEIPEGMSQSPDLIS